MRPTCTWPTHPPSTEVSISSQLNSSVKYYHHCCFKFIIIHAGTTSSVPPSWQQTNLSWTFLKTLLLIGILQEALFRSTGNESHLQEGFYKKCREQLYRRKTLNFRQTSSSKQGRLENTPLCMICLSKRVT